MKLFEHDGIFDRISILELTRSYLYEGEGGISLAGFQRDAVWKAKNVEILWDSILSWYPIGSLLLARLDEFAEVGVKRPQLSSSGNITDARISHYQKDTYILIDGQQRSNAIALGLLPWSHPKAVEAGGRLWIDLGEIVESAETRYRFYLCTSKDPFGEEIKDSEKRRGFESLGLIGKDDSEIQLDESYPIKAKMPVPFAEFVDLVRHFSNWNQIINCLIAENRLNISDDTYKIVKDKMSIGKIRSDIDYLIQEVMEVIVDEKYQIPLILFHKQEGHVSSKQLFKLFERININGVTPPQSEMFFSVLKLQWPLVGNYVADISRDPVLKGLHRSTDILLIALRLIKPNFDLDLSTFSSISDEEKRVMLGLLEEKPNEHSTFHRCMRLVYDALHYRGEGDYGLPRQLMSRLRKRVWQLCVIWTYLNLDLVKEGIPENRRQELIQFALMDSLDYFSFRFPRNRRIFNDSKFYREFEKIIRSSDNIPIRRIMEKAWEIVENYDEVEIMSPATYLDWISSPINGSSINWNSHLRGNVFLLYSQRDFLSKWEDLDDIDKDHIIPQNWMNFTGPTSRDYYWKVEIVDHFGRGPVLHSPGNIRFWPSSLNRQYHDKPPSSKFIHKQRTSLLDSYHQDRALMTVDDLLKASAIDTALLDLLERLELMKGKEDKRIWTTDQYLLFKQFTEMRCGIMYKDIYESASFNNMLSAQKTLSM